MKAKNNSYDIHPSVRFGTNVKLGNFITIEEDCEIGDDTFIGNGCVLRPRTKIGNNCKIGHLTVFEGNCEIGNNTIIQSQCHITAGAIIGDDVFMGPFSAMANDRKMCHLRRHVIPFVPEAPRIERAVRIGTSTVIMPGIIIGENAVIGAGSVVTKDVPARKIAIGVPASIIGGVPNDEII